MNDSNVTRWIHELGGKDHGEAARKLWEYYFDQVILEARRRFQTTPRRDADEEDVAVSVFDNLFRKAGAGEFSELADRNELRALLFRLTKDQVVDRIRRYNTQKRGGGQVRGESVFYTAPDSGDPGLDGIPTPEKDYLDFADDYAAYLAALPNDSLRKVAQLRAEGNRCKDIADALGITVRVVEHKLAHIRRIWSMESLNNE